MKVILVDYNREMTRSCLSICKVGQYRIISLINNGKEAPNFNQK